MNSDFTQYLQPEMVSRLNSLDLQARLIVEGYLAGLHRSPYHGFSVEFAEYRPYIAGESIRHLDWKKYARSDRLVVREFEDNTNLKAFLFMDCSGSMAYASNGNITKLKYSIYLAAALAYLLHRQRDAVGLVLAGGSTAESIRPRTTRAHLLEVLKALHGVNAEGAVPLASCLHRFADQMGRRGLAVLFSDMLEDPTPLLQGIKHLRHLDHEVIVFHLLDPAEVAFGFRRSATFEDVETGDKLVLDPLKIQREYQKEFRAHLGLIQSECLGHQVDYHRFTTDLSFDKALTAFLRKRSQLV